MSTRRISLYVVYDLIGTFGIGGGNHLGTVRTVEKEMSITLYYSDHGHYLSPGLTLRQDPKLPPSLALP
jgi:hypothetical protein